MRDCIRGPGVPDEMDHRAYWRQETLVDQAAKDRISRLGPYGSPLDALLNSEQATYDAVRSAVMDHFNSRRIAVESAIETVQAALTSVIGKRKTLELEVGYRLRVSDEAGWPIEMLVVRKLASLPEKLPDGRKYCWDEPQDSASLGRPGTSS